MSGNPPQKTICFVADQPGWAFDRSVQNLAKALGVLGVHSTCYYQGTLPKAFGEEYIYVSWWPDVQWISERITPRQRIICRVADMATWNTHAPSEWQEKFRQVVHLVDSFSCASAEIDETLHSTGIWNSFILGDSVDTDAFSTKTFASGGKPVLGWCGNPRALEWIGFEDVKGLSALDILWGREDIRFVTATEVPAVKMPDWYRAIDIYVCASRLEGTPLPLIEAMSVGNVVVTTNVGVVPEISSRGLFVFNGTHGDLKSTLEDLLRLRREWSQLGLENRNYILKNRTPVIAAQRLHSVLWGPPFSR